MKPRLCLWAALLVGAILGLVIPTAYGETDEPGDSTAESQNMSPDLFQVVTSDEAFAPKGQMTEISSGHVDLGPVYKQGRWQLMVRDDSGEKPIWRHLSDVVFRVSDAAEVALPADPTYDFIHADSSVWAVPQNEIENVVWLGWNTQFPEVSQSVNATVALTYGGHQGPGEFHVFVQAGNFTGPDRIWDSDRRVSQPAHLELNTHTHANWVFTKPGIHLVKLSAQAQLRDGSMVEDSQILRFAVGDKADAAQARNEKWQLQTKGETVDVSQPKPEENDLVAWFAVTALLMGALVSGAAVWLWLRKQRKNQRLAELRFREEGGETAA